MNECIGECEICGSEVGPNDEPAEMYDPTVTDGGAVFCHAECGLARGFKVA